MYRVGIVINENEVSHSKYADTLSTLNSALDTCNLKGAKGNSYHFTIFDKFNIHKLFSSGEDNIMSFDGIVVATNAMSFNEKIYTVFCNNKQIVEEFINKNKGLFISSQKKLSNGSLLKEKFKSAGFLPDTFDYYLFDRPEKYSADGEVNVSSDVTNKILLYPYEISNQIIKDHCENNQFIVHKYRSLIIPKHSNSYETLLCDNTSPTISQRELGYINNERKVLLSSRYNKRVVISSMALDWANHTELLCNILTFITEDRPPTFFVKKGNEQIKSTIIDSYIIRANTANIPYRVISESEINNSIKTPGNAYIFSPNWQSEEIEKIYSEMLIAQSDYFSIYHICQTDVVSNKSHKLSKYCNFSSVDMMKDSVIQNLLSNYLSTSWNKSVWTYSYILTLIDSFDLNIPIIAKKVYEELSLHFTKTETVTGKTELTGDYDNVFNATCKMLEILNYFQRKYRDSVSSVSSYKIENVIKAAEAWALSRIDSGAVFDQDVCYCLLYLVKYDRYDALSDNTKKKLSQLFTQLLTNIIEEILTMKIDRRSSVDLCRVHQTLCILTLHNIYTIEKTTTYLDKIEAILKERQDVYGNWKNISETSEITAMLLDAYDLRSKISTPMSTINTLITKGIEVLYSQFNPRTNMWSDDLGTTAKAMYAIGIYDKIFNFAINDFFVDLKNNQESKVDIKEEIRFDRVSNFYQTIDSLEKQKEILNKDIMIKEKDILILSKKISRSRRFSLVLVSVLISLLFIVVLTFAILYLNYREVLFTILGDWQSHFVAGFIGFIMSVVLTAIYSLFNEKIRE